MSEKLVPIRRPTGIKQGEWPIDERWIVTHEVGDYFIDIRVEDELASVFVECRGWTKPICYFQIAGDSDGKGYRDRKIVGTEVEFLALARATINDQGLTAPYLADWLYQETGNIEITVEAWERLIEVIRRCSPDTLQSVVIANLLEKKRGSAPPVTVSPGAPSPAPLPAVPPS